MRQREIVFLILLLVIVPVIAQAQLEQRIPKPRIKTIGVLGKGLAISPTDLMDFKIIRMGVLKVSVFILGEETEIIRGLIFIDNEKYVIKDINLANDSFSGNLYQNGTLKGSISLTLVIKNHQIVWVGTLTLGDTSYNSYILEAPRLPKREEIKEDIEEFCEEHPEKCREKIRGIGPGYCEKTFDPSCREKIANFCSEHPDDRRCKALRMAFCLANREDTRCRQWLKEICERNPTSPVCRAFRVRSTERYCEEHPLSKECIEIQRERIIDYCTEHPDDIKCQQIKRTREFIQKAHLARYCSEHPDEEECEEFCLVHPLICKRLPPALRRIAEQTNRTLEIPEVGEIE